MTKDDVIRAMVASFTFKGKPLLQRRNVQADGKWIVWNTPHALKFLTAGMKAAETKGCAGLFVRLAEGRAGSVVGCLNPECPAEEP